MSDLHNQETPLPTPPIFLSLILNVECEIKFSMGGLLEKKLPKGTTAYAPRRRLQTDVRRRDAGVLY